MSALRESEGNPDAPNAFDVPTFCRRNNISSTNTYRAARHGFLRLSKLFGRTVVTVEDEAEFRKKLRAGELQWPKAKSRGWPKDKPRGRKPKAAGAERGDRLME